VNYKPIARVDFLVVHCSATREGHEFNAADIDRMHRQRGFKKIGYHYVIKLDGTVEKGRPDSEPGAHVEGYNSRSLGICYIGGLEDKPYNGKWDHPKDTRTPAQIAALTTLLKRLTAEHPRAEVLGHRDIPGVRKACPCFDVRPWWLTAKK
jgi:N-acetylmuramoyl-L-alanine amidase